MRGNSFKSAPAAKMNGLPVITSASQSPDSSSETTGRPDSRALRPKTVGFVWSSPLSTVTSARRPSGLVTTCNLNSVSAANVLPEECRPHAEADAERGQAVANVGALPESVGELRQ